MTAIKSLPTYFYKKITFLTVILTFLIVVHHATPNLRFGLILSRDTPIIYGMKTLTEIAVPLFFFISGLLFYYNCNKEVLAKKITRRIRSLIIPYLLWNTLFFVIYWFLSHWEVSASRMHMVAMPSGISDIMLRILDSRFTPLWFVKDLIIFTVFAPIIFLLINTRNLAIFTLSLTLLAGLFVGFSYKNPLTWLPVYLQGAILGKYYYDLPARQRANAITGLFSSKTSSHIACIITCASFISLYILVYLIPNSIIVFRYATPLLLWIITDFVLGRYLNTSFEIKAWMGYTFFIYCTHYFVLNILQKLAVLNFKPTELFLTVLMIITPAVTIVLLIFIASKLSDFRIYKILTGGRGA